MSASMAELGPYIELPRQWPQSLHPTVLAEIDAPTPFLAGDLSLLARRFTRFTSALPRVRPFYAVKCNSAPEVLQTAKTQRWTPEELLRTLVEAECSARDASRRATRMRAAGFPVVKSLEEFQLSSSSVPKATFDYLVSLEWIRGAENLCLVGPAGTGKSHLLVALGHAAVEANDGAAALKAAAEFRPEVVICSISLPGDLSGLDVARRLRQLPNVEPAVMACLTVYGGAALRDKARRGRSEAGQDGPVEVRAIIPGVVVAVSVAAGDQVSAGQQLLVVEAMKMQNELRSPRDGVVGRLPVGERQTIEVGDLLAVIE